MYLPIYLGSVSNHAKRCILCWSHWRGQEYISEIIDNAKQQEDLQKQIKQVISLYLYCSKLSFLIEFYLLNKEVRSFVCLSIRVSLTAERIEFSVLAKLHIGPVMVSCYLYFTSWVRLVSGYFLPFRFKDVFYPYFWLNSHLPKKKKKYYQKSFLMFFFTF